MDTLYCMLENGVDLYVNEHQNIRDYHARSAEERRRKKKNYILTSRCAYVNFCKLTLYRDVIYSFDCISAIEYDGGV